jgi:uncharacterized protein (TIGR02588 family)
VAEWISLGVSALLLLGLAGYLLFQASQPRAPYITVEARPMLSDVRQEAGRYILPVAITNQGRRTLRELQVEVSYQSAGGRRETREVQIDYLGQQSRQEVYLYFDRDPRELQVQCAPLYYRLD